MAAAGTGRHARSRGGLAHIVDKHVERQKDLTLDDLAKAIPHMRVVHNDGATADWKATRTVRRCASITTARARVGW
jgi:hypothetical protein